MEFDLLTLTEFGSQIGKSERQVRRYVESGKLQAVETTAGPRIPTSELENWTKGRRQLTQDAAVISGQPPPPAATFGQDVTDFDGITAPIGHILTGAAMVPEQAPPFSARSGQVLTNSDKVTAEAGHFVTDAAMALEQAPPPAATFGQIVTGSDKFTAEGGHIVTDAAMAIEQAPPSAATSGQIVTSSDMTIQLSKALDHSNRLLTELQRTQEKLEQEREAREKERDEKERALRRADLLTSEIASYQRVLTDQAESLAEQRALLHQQQARQETEHQVLETDYAQHQRLKLDVPAPAGWGSRLRRLLGLGRKTG